MQSTPEGTVLTISLESTSSVPVQVYVFYETGGSNGHVRHGGWDESLHDLGWTNQGEGPQWEESVGVEWPMEMWSARLQPGDDHQLPATTTSRES